MQYKAGMRVDCTTLLLVMMTDTWGLTHLENMGKKDVQLRVLKMAPELSDSWYEVEKPEFLLVIIPPNASKDFILDSQNNPRRLKRSPGLFSSW